jgi:hypothetical protein
MNFEALEKEWQKQIVTGGTLPSEATAARLKREVASAQRRIRGGITLAAFVWFSGWAVTIAAHFTSIKPITPIAAFADVVNALLLVLFFVRAFRSARAVRNETSALGGTVRESISATLRTAELQINNARIAGFAIPIVIAINAWMCIAKYLAGDLPGFGAVVGSAFMAGFGTVIGAIIWYRYRMNLAPRREELREMLRTLGNGD